MKILLTAEESQKVERLMFKRQLLDDEKNSYIIFGDIKTLEDGATEIVINDKSVDATLDFLETEIYDKGLTLKMFWAATKGKLVDSWRIIKTQLKSDSYQLKCANCIEQHIVEMKQQDLN